MLAPIALLVLAFADPATVQVEPFKLDVAAIKAKATTEVRVTEKGGTAAVYKGIPLRALLDDHVKGPEGMSRLRSLSDAVLLVRATDDYQAALSAAEVAMDKDGTRYLLATERNGEPLDVKQGPLKLIVPGDSEHVRWVRMVSAVDLVRMPRPKGK